jgi:hypothetical protein
LYRLLVSGETVGNEPGDIGVCRKSEKVGEVGGGTELKDARMKCCRWQLMKWRGRVFEKTKCRQRENERKNPLAYVAFLKFVMTRPTERVTTKIFFFYFLANCFGHRVQAGSSISSAGGDKVASIENCL